MLFRSEAMNQKGTIIISVKPGSFFDQKGNKINATKIDIRDTGPGIDEKILPYLFEAFRTNKDNPENLGLGLSIAMKNVLFHNGLLTVENPGTGALFIVFLPQEL